MSKKKKNRDKEHVETGMVVEATQGNLGEDDISKPKVSAVTRNKTGEIEELTVQKGVVFKKTLDIPADRIQSVDQDGPDTKNAGKVVVDVSKTSLQESSPQVGEGNGGQQPAPSRKPANFIFRVLGPGFLGGMSGNDASAV